MHENKNHQQEWERYRERELAAARVTLARLGYELDHEQIHIGGERFLMVGNRDVGGGGYKLVLTGRRLSDKKRVVIKCSSDSAGIREIESEHRAREMITSLDFAYHTFEAPEEILYTRADGLLISIVAYIEQAHTFLSRPLKEQFNFALTAFKNQEGVHATTYAHAKKIRSALGLVNAEDYLRSFKAYKNAARANDPAHTALSAALESAEALLQKDTETIQQYCGFLTHSDFLPHNLRIADEQIYLLDYASIHFGNKHESWARFLNFMSLYNRPVEEALLQYVRDNRTPEEYLSLRLMRIYKLGFLLQFYTSALQKTSGDLQRLARERVSFWTRVLQSLIDDKPLPESVIEEYKKTRDALRSEEEKRRQKELH